MGVAVSEAALKRQCRVAMTREGWYVHRIEPGRGADLGYPDTLVHMARGVWPIEFKWLGDRRSGWCPPHLGLRPAQRSCIRDIVQAGCKAFVVHGAADWVRAYGAGVHADEPEWVAAVGAALASGPDELPPALYALMDGLADGIPFTEATSVAPLRLPQK